MSRSLRYLRIAFSATCLTACVLLIALWARSYWWEDSVMLSRPGATILLTSDLGKIGCLQTTFNDLPDDTNGYDWHVVARARPDGFSMVHWLVFGVVAILLFGNRLPNIARSLGRSLLEFKRGMSDLEGEFKTNLFDPNLTLDETRTLLIATMLVAVVLGLCVYVARQ